MIATRNGCDATVRLMVEERLPVSEARRADDRSDSSVQTRRPVSRQVSTGWRD
jgi:hypothetical protein